MKDQTDGVASGVMLINFDDAIVHENQSQGPTAGKLLSCSNIKSLEIRPLSCTRPVNSLLGSQ